MSTADDDAAAAEPASKKQKAYSELTDEEKKQRRLRQNRLAAKRSYNKRVARQAEMEGEYQKLREELVQTTQQIQVLSSYMTKMQMPGMPGMEVVGSMGMHPGNLIGPPPDGRRDGGAVQHMAGVGIPAMHGYAASQQNEFMPQLSSSADKDGTDLWRCNCPCCPYNGFHMQSQRMVVAPPASANAIANGPIESRNGPTDSRMPNANTNASANANAGTHAITASGHRVPNLDPSLYASGRGTNDVDMDLSSSQ